MNCVVCNVEFESKRGDAKYCSPKCRKEASRLKSIVTDNVTLSDIPVTLNFKFTIKHIPANTGVDTSDIAEQKAKPRTAIYWYDVPLAALPVPQKGWPTMPEFMNGRQYFLWWKNEFKTQEDGTPIIHNPLPKYDKLQYVNAGEDSRRWGTN
jgi:hypothetical protein